MSNERRYDDRAAIEAGKRWLDLPESYWDAKQGVRVEFESTEGGR